MKYPFFEFQEKNVCWKKNQLRIPGNQKQRMKINGDQFFFGFFKDLFLEFKKNIWFSLKIRKKRKGVKTVKKMFADVQWNNRIEGELKRSNLVGCSLALVLPAGTTALRIPVRGQLKKILKREPRTTTVTNRRRDGDDGGCWICLLLANSFR